MERIDKPDELTICEFDGVNSGTVYIGGLSYLQRANDDLKWRVNVTKSIDFEIVYKELTLSEIAEQLRAPIITVIVEKPLAGAIYQYGNYGDSWYKIGETDGYA